MRVAEVEATERFGSRHAPRDTSIPAARNVDDFVSSPPNKTYEVTCWRPLIV